MQDSPKRHPFLPQTRRGYIRLLADVIVYLVAVYGILEIVGIYAKGPYYFPTLAGLLLVVAFVAWNDFRLPQVVKEARGSRQSPIVVRSEALGLIVTPQTAVMEVSRAMYALDGNSEGPFGDYVESGVNETGSWNPQSCDYATPDAEVIGYKLVKRNWHSVKWKPRSRLPPFELLRHRYSYKPVGGPFDSGFSYVSHGVMHTTGILEIKVTNHHRISECICFCTRRHFRRAESILQQALIAKERGETIHVQVRNTRFTSEIKSEVENPEWGMVYYLGWTHGHTIRDDWWDVFGGRVERLKRQPIRRFLLPSSRAIWATYVAGL